MSELRVALVTGSGKKRVGFEVARLLGHAGYKLILHYRSSREEALESIALLQREGLSAHALAADLSRETEVQALVQEVMRLHGRIDALVTCASQWGRQKLEQIDASSFQQQFEANTLTTALISLVVGRQMVKQESGGGIVTLGDWALQRPYLDYLAYHTSKGAVAAFTKALASECFSPLMDSPPCSTSRRASPLDAQTPSSTNNATGAIGLLLTVCSGASSGN